MIPSLRITFVVAFTALSLSMAHGADGASRPNVLLIITDDMRFDDLTSEGHPYIQTPNIDRLAREGARFVNAYVTSPVCAPSRASVFTAQQPSVHGRYQNFWPVEKMEPFLPEAFHQAGYRTAFIGKFYEENAQAQIRKAYDHWFAIEGPSWPGGKAPEDADERKRVYDERLYYDQSYTVNDETRVIPGYETDVLFDETARYATEDPSRPFFISLNPHAPHKPWNPSPKRKDKYAGKGIPPGPNVSVKGLNPRIQKELVEACENGAEMIEDIDEALGRLYDSLKKSGQLDNTIIVFTSDNGEQHGEHGAAWKRQAWQESIKVPFLVRYPAAAKAGTKVESLISLADIMPTFAELTGVTLPTDPLRYGRSFAGVLQGDLKDARRDVLVVQYFQPKKPDPNVVNHLDWACVVRWPYKLVRFAPNPYGKDGPPGSLFDLAKDPHEDRDLYGDPSFTGTRSSLYQRLKELMEENHAPIDWMAPEVHTTSQP